MLYVNVPQFQYMAKSASDKKNTSVRLSKDVITLMELLASKDERTNTYIIEKAIKEMAEREGVKLPKPKK